jgi:hypothetical protein
MQKESVVGSFPFLNEIGLLNTLVFRDRWSILDGDAVGGDPCRGREACHGDPCRGREACSGDPGYNGPYEENNNLYLRAFGEIPAVNLSVHDLLKARIAALRK